MQCGCAAIFQQCYGFGKNRYISSPNTVIYPRFRTAIHASSNCKTFSEQCLSTVTCLSYSRILFVHIRLRNEVQPNLAFFYFSEEQLLFWNCPFGMTELIRTPKFACPLKEKKTCWKENVIFQHIPTNHQFLGNWLVFRGPHITLPTSAGSREWRTCWAREAARKTLGSPCGVSFWSGKGWVFFWIRNSPSGSGVGIMGETDAVCQALWYGVRFLRQFTFGDIVTRERFLGAICLNCILLPSWQSTGVNQPSTWISTADAQDKSPDTPKWASSSIINGGSVGSQTVGQICSKICFQSIFQARIAEVFGIIIHSMGLGLRLQCSAGEICTTTLARSWSIWSQITLLCCESQGVSGRSASWMKKKRW